MKLYCCGCGKFVEPKLCDGTEIYPHRPNLKYKWFYKCETCGNYVGTHGKWGKARKGNIKKGENFTKTFGMRVRALGCIPTKDVRNARHFIHEILDPLWQEGGTWHRTALYAEIAKRLGIKEYHTANTKSVEECRNVYKIVLQIKKENNKE